MNSDEKSSSSEPRRRNPQLLLHGEGGSFPFLTPHLLSTYFPQSSSLVSNRLILGMEMIDCCVVPVYPSDEKKEEELPRSKPQQQIDDASSEDASKSIKGDNNNDKLSKRQKRRLLKAEKKKLADAKNNSVHCKPRGYTFVGRNVHSYLGIPSGYETMITPTFDLVDCFSSYAKKNISGGSDLPPPCTTANELSLATSHGWQRITPTLFRSVTENLKGVTSSLMMYDQTPDNHPKSNAKRKKQTVEQTTAWVEHILQKQENNDTNASSTTTNLWGPIVGGNDLELRRQSAKSMAKQQQSNHHQIGGVALVGIHHAPTRTLRQNLVEACLSELVPGTKSAVLVARDISEILDAAILGRVNVIGTALPALLAREHRALVFDVHGWREKEQQGENNESNHHANKKIRLDTRENEKSSDVGCGINGGTINLADKCFQRDTRPLIADCKCLACSRPYMRAYIHHLVSVQELLGDILLFCHNLHHLLVMFEQMEIAIEEGMGKVFMSYVERQLVES